MTPNLSIKQWASSHFIMSLILALSLYQFLGLDQKTTVSFLDVGQGDAILIQTSEYKNILVDTGPDGKVVDELSKKLGFFNQKIDLFILTHPDLDHYGGALDILQKYPVKQVMLTGLASSSELYVAFLSNLKARNISVIFPDSSQDLQIGNDAYLDILYPFEEQSLMGVETKNKNNTSIGLIIRDGLGAPLVLLTGDAEAELERDLLLSAQDLTAPILKLGHHGSKTSSTAPFLAAIRPETVVVSAGKDNKFGHPHEEVMARVKDIEAKYTWEGAVSFLFP